MKVSELIEHLEQVDGEFEVLLSDGYLLNGAPISAIVASIIVGEEVRKVVVLSYVGKEQPTQLWPWVESPSTPGIMPLSEPSADDRDQ